MQLDEIEGNLGRPVKDLYGRHVGFLTAVCVESNGRVKTVGLEVTSGRFEEHPGSRFVVGEDGPILVPEWKVESEAIVRETSMVSKRLDALDFLYKKGEFEQPLYEEMSKEYGSRLSSLADVQAGQAKRLTERTAELDSEVVKLDRFIANLKLQRHSGEVEEHVYERMVAGCSALKAKNQLERDELTRAFDAQIEPVEVLNMTISQKSESQV